MTALALAAETEQLLQVLLAVVLGAVASIGLGAAMLVIRVILPGPAAACDRSLRRMSTGRLVLMGVLPLVGAGLLARGVELADVGAVTAAFLLLVGVPLALAWIGGLIAGLLHIGGAVLRKGTEASPLARASIGGLVTGLAQVAWIVPPLGLVVTLLLSAWFVGIGLGALMPRRSTTENQK